MFWLYPNFAYSLGTVFFSMMVRLVDGMNDCASVYCVAGLTTDSYIILASDLLTLVLMIASEMEFVF